MAVVVAVHQAVESFGPHPGKTGLPVGDGCEIHQTSGWEH